MLRPQRQNGNRQPVRWQILPRHLHHRRREDTEISSRVVDDKLTSRRAEAHASSTTRPANGLFQQPRNAENHGVPTKFSWHAVCLSHTATPLPNRIIQEKIPRSGFKTPEGHHSTRHDLAKIRSRVHHTENQCTKIVITEIYCTFVPIFNAYQHVFG